VIPMNRIRWPNVPVDRSPANMTRLVLTLVLGICFIPMGNSEPNSPQDVVVIVHPNSTIDSLSTVGLRAIFGMRNRTWQDGKPITVFVLKDDDPIHTAFTKKVLQTFPYNLRRIWDRRVYSGTGQSPVTVETEEEMREVISVTDNSIGYISRQWLNSDVKAVQLK